MSPKDKEAKPDPQATAGALAAPKAPKGPLIVVLLNTLIAFGVLGFMFYSKLVFKRPAITESGERARLESLHASPKAPPALGLVNFDSITVNIQTAPATPRPADGTNQQIHGKMHYVTLAFSVELRDLNDKGRIDVLRPVLLDRFVSVLGRKSFYELTTVQGRYLLRTQFLDIVNRALNEESGTGRVFASNVYFSRFEVQ